MSDANIPVAGTSALLQTYRNNIGGSDVDSEAVTPTDQFGKPFTDSNQLPVRMPQSLDANNTATRTSTDGATQFVGTWTQTRSVGIVRQLVVLASTVTSGLGGTFVFEYSEDGVNPTISESRPISTFSTVRDFDLINAGEYFRVKFTPSRALTGGELVFITTTQRRQNDGAFVRLADQQIEKQNAALSQTFAYLKGFGLDGISADVPLGGFDPTNSSSTGLGTGGTFTGTYRKTSGFNAALCFAFSDQPLTVTLRWSRDGVTTRPGLIGTSAVPQTLISGFYVYLTTLTTMIDEYVRLEITNGATPTTLFEADLWFYTDTFPGSYGGLTAALSSLSTALLTRSVQAGYTPDATFANASIQGRHSANSTTTPLPGNTGGTNHIYRGTWFEWQATHGKLITDLFADVDGTLYIDFSEAPTPTNGDDSSVEDSITLSYDPDEDANPLLRRQTPVQSRWVRHRYVNGIAAQSVFQLDAAFLVNDPGLVTQSLDILPRLGTEAGIVRTIPAIPTADGTGFREIPLSAAGNPMVRVEGVDDPINIKPLTSANTSQVVCGVSAAQRLDLSPLTNRKSVMFQNMEQDVVSGGSVTYGNRGVWGHSSSLTEATGFDLPVQVPFSLLLDASVPIYVRARSSGSGTTNTQVLTGTGSSGTATNPANAKALDTVYANMTAAAQTIDISGYSITPTLTTLQNIYLRVTGKKQSGQFETATFVETVAGRTAGSGTMTSDSPLTGGTALNVVVSISRNATNTITSVTCGSVSFARIGTPLDQGGRRLEHWWAYGTIPNASVVVSMDTATNGHFAATVVSNGSAATPNVSTGATGTGTAVTGSGVSGMAKGFAIAAVSHESASATPGSGYTERVDETNGTGSNIDSFYLETKPLVSTGTETATATLIASSAWAIQTVAIAPADAADPVATLSYKLSGVTGATTYALTFTQTTPSSVDIEITGDRAWTFADVPNVDAILTATAVSAASADVDSIQLVIVETSSPTVRVCLHQGAVPDG